MKNQQPEPQFAPHRRYFPRQERRFLSTPGPARSKFACWPILLLTTTLALFANLTAAQDSTSQANTPSIMGDPFNVLDPDEAFLIETGPAQTEQLDIHFTIEPGHYLYRNKMAVLTEHPGLQITETETPLGIETHDEFFGKTEIYRDSATITAHFSYQPGDAPDIDEAELTLQYQGCADIGICYPPQEKVLKLDLSAAIKSAQAGTSGIATEANSGNASISDQLGSSLSALMGGADDEQELLPPEVAFIPSVGPQEENKLAFRFSIEEGYYLYRDKINATLIDSSGASGSAIELPEGAIQEDAYFGRVQIFRNNVEGTLLLKNVTQQTEASVSLDYQGCADIGVCFPPQTMVLPITLKPSVSDQTTVGVVSQAPAQTPNATQSTAQSTIQTSTPAKTQSAATQANLANPATLADNTNTAAVAQTEQDRLAATLSTQSIWIIIATFFGLGLLLAFTPCVFPMVPILSSLIVGQGESITTRKAFALSLTYVLAMALTYTIAGVIVGLSGENIQIWFQNPWVLSAFALLFVLLALSMFGFYELQMPVAIQQKLNNMSNSAEGGTFIGAGIMGFLSALVVGPCVTAPLVGALIFIADTGDALVGGSALFALSMGMGAPLLLIGASAGKLLPKSGAWMNTTKAVFGVLLLGLAIWMLSRIIPAPVTLVLTAALLIVSGIYLGATDTLNPEVSGWRKLSKGLGLVVLVYGMTLLVGALGGGKSLLQPLEGILASTGNGGNSSTNTHQGELVFKRVRSVAEVEQVVASAAQNQQTVMLDFYADWCVTCKEMEAFTFTDSGVQKRLEATVLIQADVTANNEDDKALLKKYGLFGPPGIIFYAPDGNEIRDARMVGFMSAEKFSAHLDQYL